MQRDEVVVVALATYRRPGLLRDCLESLREQTIAPDRYEICVVDNDPEQSARAIVEAFADEFDGVVSYVHEPTPGIPAARNAAVAFASKRGADWLAFIDDDEQATAGWLIALLEAALEFGADGVQGPVVPRFEPGASTPVAEFGVHDETIAPRGTRLTHAKTGNLLLSMRRLTEVGGPAPFDASLSDVGGSDTQLTMRLTRAGASIVTEPSAVVHEFVPLERQTIEWLTRRAMRTSSSWVIFQRQHNSGFRFWVRRARALNRWASRAVFYWVRHKIKGAELDRMRSSLCAARVRGQIMGMRGNQVAEYARPEEGVG